MGNYTHLYLGKYFFSWKNEIPEYLAFIFEPTELYAKKHETEEWCDELGFSTTCFIAKARMEKYGYSIAFFSEIYDFFYEEIFRDVRAAYKDYFENYLEGISAERSEELFWEIISRTQSKSREDQLLDFIALLKQIMSDNYINPPSVYMSRTLREAFAKHLWSTPEPHLYDIKHIFDDGSISLNMEDLSTYLLHEGSQVYPYWMPILSTIFSNLAYGYDYLDIFTLMFLRIVLEAVEPDITIKLELGDILDSEEEALSLLPELSQSLINKVNLYNKVFASLFANEANVRTTYIKDQCKLLLQTCHSTTNIYDKGKALEIFTELLFTSSPELQLLDKRVSTGDEEIDLILKNNINRPFWLAFQSPLLFIECKNWKDPVGTSEIRNFEIKLQNHRALVRVGIFIAINGFSGETKSELKRLGRDDYHVILLDEGDITEFIQSSESFFDWIEKKVARIF